jgi:outer membrane protein OmpA-like peptidoglycan-associated protein
MLKRFLGSIGVGVMALSLSGCGPKVSKWCVENDKEPIMLPCIIPNGLPDDAMGRLGIQVIHLGNKWRIIVPVDPVFDIRSPDIRESAYPALNLLAKRIRHFIPRCISVKGYTDSLGGYYEDDWLSEMQARSLITYLWTQGVPHECLTPAGKGKDDAYTVASNRYVDGAAANRRIEITFVSN